MVGWAQHKKPGSIPVHFATTRPVITHVEIDDWAVSHEQVGFPSEVSNQISTAGYEAGAQAT
jgi:hypothetical protein